MVHLGESRVNPVDGEIEARSCTALFTLVLKTAACIRISKCV